jgi:uncharacterized protein (TIGR03118 family)
MLGAALLALSPAWAGPANAATTNAFTAKVVATNASDANLVDPWGLAASTGSPWWVANAGSDTTTLYTADGTPNALVIANPGMPTGTVFNGTGGFQMLGTPATFIFANRDGTIRAWAPTAGTNVLTTVNKTGSASYTGVTIDASSTGTILLAANFLSGLIDGFDDGFHQETLTGFIDPVLPAGYAPFNVRRLGGTVFVSYAERGTSGEVVIGKGKGVVAAYDPNGGFLTQVASGGPLNAPWGMALAPNRFAPFGGDLLVANSGNGQIHAYRWNGQAYTHDGVVRGANGKPLRIAGLHGIEFGNGGNAGPKTRLSFTAGPNGGGELGFLKPAA